jgi:serine/threonine protein kinase
MRFFEANGSAYMVMEFVEGASLVDWIKPKRPLAEAQVLDIVGPLLDGLEVVHRAGFTHRDIKPANVYMREDGSPVLLDFGSARQKSSELTAVVSPGYAPFEQYHTQGKQGPWSDLYALGGVLYWMVTGERPVESVARVRQDTLKPAVQVGDRNRYRAELLAAIDWALAPNEDERPQSIAEWKKALMEGEARPEPKTQKLPAAAPAPQTIEAAYLDKLEADIAQHLGPIASTIVKRFAKAATSKQDLVHAVARELPDEARAAFEKKWFDRSQPVSLPKSAMADPPTAMAASRFPQAVLDKAENQLAEYIGAVARVVVKRAALKARDEAELYLLIADEIEDKAEKKAFIRKAVSISGKP